MTPEREKQYRAEGSKAHVIHHSLAMLREVIAVHLR
jgi:hypothetical protein